MQANNLLICLAVSPVAMWLLYLVGIQFNRGGWWQWLLPITITAYLLDVVLNYTLFALLTLDFPQRGEFSFSNRLSRLVNDLGWRGAAARWVAR